MKHKPGVVVSATVCAISMYLLTGCCASGPLLYEERSDLRRPHLMNDADIGLPRSQPRSAQPWCANRGVRSPQRETTARASPEDNTLCSWTPTPPCHDVCCDLRFDCWFKALAAAGAPCSRSFPDRPGLSSIWNILSARLGIASGSFLFCRRDAFRQIGGFSRRLYVCEDIWLSMRLKWWGRRRSMPIRVIRTAAVMTSSRKFTWYPPARLFGMAAALALFPFGILTPYLCPIWYARPK